MTALKGLKRILVWLNSKCTKKFNPFRAVFAVLVVSTGFTGGYSHLAPLEQGITRIFSIEKRLFNSANQQKTDVSKGH
jgi:hypothetical protein